MFSIEIYKNISEKGFSQEEDDLYRNVPFSDTIFVLAIYVSSLNNIFFSNLDCIYKNLSESLKSKKVWRFNTQF